MTPYAGPFEMLTLEQAAARFNCSAEHFASIYDGPRHYLGEGASVLRFPAWALHEWSVAHAYRPGAKAAGSAWDTIGNGETAAKDKKRLSKREGGAT